MEGQRCLKCPLCGEGITIVIKARSKKKDERYAYSGVQGLNNDLGFIARGESGFKMF